MINIDMYGEKIFTFKKNSYIQILGSNHELKRNIIDIMVQVFNGYRYSDIEINYMNNYYPRLYTEDGSNYSKGDKKVYRLSSYTSILNELTLDSNSILLNYINKLSDKLVFNKRLDVIEKEFVKLSIELDKIINEEFKNDFLSIETSFTGLEFKKIIKNYYEVRYMNQKMENKPMWLFSEKESVYLYCSVLESLLNKNEKILLILEGIDADMSEDIYGEFLEMAKLLLNTYPNLNLINIPSNIGGIDCTKEAFENSYICNNQVLELKDIDSTYESICRNYPNNNYPDMNKIIEVILKIYPFHSKYKEYNVCVESIILQIFLELIDENDLIIKNEELTSLERNFLTKLIN